MQWFSVARYTGASAVVLAVTAGSLLRELPVDASLDDFKDAALASRLGMAAIANTCFCALFLAFRCVVVLAFDELRETELASLKERLINYTLFRARRRARARAAGESAGESAGRGTDAHTRCLSPALPLGRWCS